MPRAAVQNPPINGIIRTIVEIFPCEISQAMATEATASPTSGATRMRFHVPTVTRIITIVAVEATDDIEVLSWRTNRLTEITANTQSIMNPAKNPAATARAADLRSGIVDARKNS